MGIIAIDTLVEAGVHFGHKVSRWNPKMEQFIYGRRSAIHIIDLRQTVRGLVTAHHFLRRMAATGGEVLFVGTKRQAKSLVRSAANSCGMHAVSERWLGGMLTNFTTIRSRLKRLEELEALESDGRMEALSKKMISSLRREKRKILRNLDGVRRMDRLPSALIVIDPHKEHIAVAEANKLDIPTVALVDTDSDPDRVDIIIPGNDDAFRSIQIVLNLMASAVEKGRGEHLAFLEARRKAEEEKQPQPVATIQAPAATAPPTEAVADEKLAPAPAPAPEADKKPKRGRKTARVAESADAAMPPEPVESKADGPGE